MRLTRRWLATSFPALVDIFWLTRQPRREVAVWRDYLQIWWKLRFLRQAVNVDPAGRTVVIPLFTDWPFEIKQHLMLASALSLSGWTTTVIVDSALMRRTLRYARAFGITSIRFYQEIELSSQEQERCSAAAAKFLSRPMSFEQIKTWTFQKCNIGPQLLASASRALMNGAIDTRDDLLQTTLRAALPSVLENASRAEALMKELKPDLLIVNEANYTKYGPLVDAAIAGGSEVIHFTQPWQDDALMCKRLTKSNRRSHPSSVSKETMRALQTQAWTEALQILLDQVFYDRYAGRWALQARNQPLVRNLDWQEIQSSLNLSRTRPVGIIFSHVLWDANLFYGIDLFEGYGDWFIQTVRGAIQNEKVDWLLKIHPANEWKRAYAEERGEYAETRLIRDHFGTLPAHVKLVMPSAGINSLVLYKEADFGVTVRGTPGMEMPCFGKPVLTAGTGRYSGLGFTIDSASRAEYLQRLAKAHLLKPLRQEEVDAAKRHAYALFILRPWQMRSFGCRFRAAAPRHPLDHNVVVLAQNLEEIEAHGDLRRWREWASSNQSDYLEIEESGTRKFLRLPLSTTDPADVVGY